MAENTKIDLKGEIAETNQYGDGIRYVVLIGKGEDCYKAGIDEIFDSIKENPFLDGVTFSGDEPFEYAGILSLLYKRLHGIGLDIITDTKYTLCELKERAKDDASVLELLKETDTLIDGTFVKAEDENAEIKGIFDMKSISL